MKHERRQNGARVSFIGYKGTADWLLPRILKWIADRLILYPNQPTNEPSIERNFSNPFKNMKAAYRQQKMIFFLFRCPAFKGPTAGAFAVTLRVLS